MQAKHASLDVQRASVRCLGLFGLLERKPSENTVKQLRCSFVKGPPSITIMASKALLDLGIWHGPDEMDKAMKSNLSSQLHEHKMSASPVEFGHGNEDLDIELLDLLYADSNMIGVILWRLKQCLSVFFEHYPSLSANHKKCLSKAFMRVMRSLWPGINGNVAGSTQMVSNMRKRAVQASRFMLQMMQVPCSQRKLQSQMIIKVASFHAKKTAAEKAYLAALCRILVLLEFRVSEQGAIKLMRRILNRVITSVATEKELTKELWRMAERLQAIDRHPDEKLSTEQTDLILAPHLTRQSRARRRAKDEESSSDDELSPTSVVPSNPPVSRSQRASKTAALSRMTAKTSIRIDEDDDEDEDDEDDAGSEVTSDDDSEPFD
ncbi:UNVERIFIED_CONTAM: hypothetical protein Scaly_0090900 [Sesamum calycinum]|uniref:Nuclear condensin complex subunit 3 C-terminal domain-containing protein n=1 Tax=Sesamum calycinum TaxID=2727403 RepID=A0AAW2SUZ2_9LAMI